MDGDHYYDIVFNITDTRPNTIVKRQETMCE